MNNQTITISSTIPLPAELKADWQNRRAYFEAQGDTIIIKRIEPSSWDELLPKLRKAGKRISPTMVKRAIVKIRQET